MIIRVSTPVVQTARTMQVAGMFDLPAVERSDLEWDVNLTLDRPWNVGLITGPSGSGKTTIARAHWPEELARKYEWPTDRSLLDGFPAGMGVRDITGLLSSVGFSSPPSWLRPFHVLSNGEQFRATIARAMCEPFAVVDEFTSLVDRTVARIGSAAIARTVRHRGGQFVAVTCHSDVTEWLQPDWVWDGDFTWRSVQPRPPVNLSIRRAQRSEWRAFGRHHYLSTDLNPASLCYLASVEGRPAAFSAWLPFVGRPTGAKREHRTVCLPDFQGVGIGNALSNACAAMWKARGWRVFSSTGHPAMMRSRKLPLWSMSKPPALRSVGKHKIDATRAASRYTASFEYVGPGKDMPL